MILDTDKIKKTTFRSLVLALFGSFAYDLFWLFFSASAYGSTETAEDGGIESTVRKFSLVMSVISFFFRVNIIDFLTFY